MQKWYPLHRDWVNKVRELDLQLELIPDEDFPSLDEKTIPKTLREAANKESIDVLSPEIQINHRRIEER